MLSFPAKCTKKTRNVSQSLLQNDGCNQQIEAETNQTNDIPDVATTESESSSVAMPADVEKPMRSAKQVLAVGLLAVCFLIAYRLTEVRLFVYLYTLALAEEFADSVASDIGRLTNGKNYDILTFKQVDKGISGGVSLLGTFCALIASFALPLVAVAYGVTDRIVYAAIGGLAFVGTLVDSVIGAAVQALYVCNRCGKQTEVSVHCGISARLAKGIAVVDNTVVNFITGVITSLMGLLLLLL